MGVAEQYAGALIEATCEVVLVTDASGDVVDNEVVCDGLGIEVVEVPPTRLEGLKLEDVVEDAGVEEGDVKAEEGKREDKLEVVVGRDCCWLVAEETATEEPRLPKLDAGLVLGVLDKPPLTGELGVCWVVEAPVGPFAPESVEVVRGGVDDGGVCEPTLVVEVVTDIVDVVVEDPPAPGSEGPLPLSAKTMGGANGWLTTIAAWANAFAPLFTTSMSNLRWHGFALAS